MAASTQIRALLTTSDGYEVKQIDAPEPKPDELLVKVTAVGLNPADHILTSMNPPGSKVGSDTVGEVIAVGADVKDRKVGQRVAFMTFGLATQGGGGSFAEQAVIRAEATILLPDFISDEDAATLPLPYITALGALYYVLEIPQEGVKSHEWIFINAGSTSVGLYAIQLAKYSGLRVVSTASAHNLDLLKQYGADVALDRKGDYVPEIKKVTDGKLKLLLDASAAEIDRNYETLSSEGGRVYSILPFDKTKVPKNVSVKFTMAYAMSDQKFTGNFGGNPNVGSPEQHAVFAYWADKLPELVKSGQLKYLPKVVDTGLEKIPEGLAKLEEGKISGQKLVYRV